MGAIRVKGCRNGARRDHGQSSDDEVWQNAAGVSHGREGANRATECSFHREPFRRDDRQYPNHLGDDGPESARTRAARRASRFGTARPNSLLPEARRIFNAVDLCWHDLRHEYACRLAERDVPQRRPSLLRRMVIACSLTLKRSARAVTSESSSGNPSFRASF